MSTQGVAKLVSSRIAISRTVLASVEVHGADVAKELTDILFPVGVPPNLTVAGFIDALHGALSRASEDIAQADLAHAQELSDDEAPRAARDAALAGVREQIIALRNTFAAVYAPSILSAYGLGGDTPDDPELVLQRAANTAHLLSTRPIVEKPRQPGITVDAAALASALTDRANALRAALDDVRREEREAQLTLGRRDESVAGWNQRYQGIADAMTGIYELVGRGDLADRIRPTARRRAGFTEETDTTPTPAPATP